jgi:purine-binding chemotaxis protein CheW
MPRPSGGSLSCYVDLRGLSVLLLLRFELDHERYAVRSDAVREVQRAALPAALPNAPPIVRGLLNVRGELVPLVDLRARLRLPERPLRATDHLVICRVGGRTLGFAVDRAIDFIEIESERVTATDTVVSAGRRLSDRIARLPDGLLLIPDLAALLDADAELLLDRALAANS